MLRAVVLPYSVLRGAAREAFTASLAERDLVRVAEWLEGADALDRLKDALARVSPDALVVGGTTQSIKAREMAPSLPIVAWGLGTELMGARPAQMTGVRLSRHVFRRRLELLRALLPTARLIGLAYDDGYPPGRIVLPETRAAAAAMGLETRVYDVREETAVIGALERMRDDAVDAVMVMNSPRLGREGMAAVALRLRLPLFGYDWTTRAGGLASVTPDFREVGRILAGQLTRIADGESADRIPVAEHTAFWIVVNTGTATALGISVLEDVIANASEVVR